MENEKKYFYYLVYEIVGPDESVIGKGTMEYTKTDNPMIAISDIYKAAKFVKTSLSLEPQMQVIIITFQLLRVEGVEV